jgi:N-acetylmuramoyl-L-alanine amidase
LRSIFSIAKIKVQSNNKNLDLNKNYTNILKGKMKHLFIFLFGLLSLFSSLSMAQDNQRIVVLDAGHGGFDPGASGNGAVEKEIALSVTLKVGEYLSKWQNTKVIYTRDKDVFVDLNERAHIANRSGANLFVSIHCNANKSSKPYGAETYTLGLHRTKDNLEVAKTENSVIFFEKNYEQKYEGFDPNNDEDYIILTLMQNVNLEQSIHFSTKIQNQFEKRVGRKSRGVKQAGFLVLRKTTMPGVLIELGFLSNAKEAKYLKSKNGQDLMASAIYRAIKEYFIENEENSYVEEEVEETPIIKTPPVYYRVQFTSYKKKKKKNFRKFKKLKDVKFYKDGELYKYTSGNDTSYTAMLKWRDIIRNKGYKDAFIVAFKEGKRIPLKEALKQH